MNKQTLDRQTNTNPLKPKSNEIYLWNKSCIYYCLSHHNGTAKNYIWHPLLVTFALEIIYQILGYYCKLNVK